MSHAGLILGLPELEVERVDRNDAIAMGEFSEWSRVVA
jgi:hypothetical protein